MPQTSRRASYFASLNFRQEVLLAQVSSGAYPCRILVHKTTWTGKTLLARTLANVVDVPFSINDATSFTQVRHFILKASLIANSVFRLAVSQTFFPPLTVSILPTDVGEDVDMCVQRLLQSANYDPYRAR